MTPAAGPEQLRLKVRLQLRGLYEGILWASSRSWLSYLISLAPMLGIYASHPSVGAPFVLAPLSLLIFFGLPALQAWRTLRARHVRGGFTLVFSPSGITAEYNGATNFADWSHVRGARETAKNILIVMQHGTFHTVPKSQISNADVEALREILRAHVSKNVKLA